MHLIKYLIKWAKHLKQEVFALYFASKDKQTPIIAKIIAICIAIYALSPIDLIPDFIPILGFLDDIILLPAGIWIAIKLIPNDVMAYYRRQTTDVKLSKYTKIAVSSIIICSWIFILFILWRFLSWN